MTLHATFSRVVGGQCQFLAITKMVEQETQVASTRPQVGFWIERVFATESAGSVRHQLHQADGPFGRDGISAVRRFDMNEGVNQRWIKAGFTSSHGYFRRKRHPAQRIERWRAGGVFSSQSVVLAVAKLQAVGGRLVSKSTGRCEQRCQQYIKTQL